MQSPFNDSYVTKVLLMGRQRRMIRATPEPVTGYAESNVPVDVAMRGLPSPHDRPVFEATQCGMALLLER